MAYWFGSIRVIACQQEWNRRKIIPIQIYKWINKHGRFTLTVPQAKNSIKDTSVNTLIHIQELPWQEHLSQAWVIPVWDTRLGHQGPQIVITVRFIPRMSAMASQITSLAIVYSTVYSGADQRKHQSSASLAFLWGIHRWPVNSSHKGPVTPKLFPFGDVIILFGTDSMHLIASWEWSELLWVSSSASKKCWHLVFYFRTLLCFVCINLLKHVNLVTDDQRRY